LAAKGEIAMRRTICRIIAIATLALAGFAATHSTPAAHLNAGGIGVNPNPLVVMGSGI
jgi:hypothetical protein